MGTKISALIVGGGVLLDVDRVKEKLTSYDLIIACDSGYDSCKRLGISPDYTIGDMDSVENDIENTEIIKLNPEKDDTDLKAGTSVAIDKKCTSITFICVTGGRLDHFMGNLSILEYAHSLYLDAKIMDEQNEISVQSSGKKIYKNTSKYISIIPITDEIVISLENLRYKADKLVVSRTNIISVSNESDCENYSIEIHKGKAYIIKSDN